MIMTFDSKIYKQLEGTPMGSAILSTLADIVMDDLETFCIAQLSFKPIFYYRYVDDIIFCVPCDKINYTLEIFNNSHHVIIINYNLP